jgi:hypothetical protein
MEHLVEESALTGVENDGHKLTRALQARQRTNKLAWMGTVLIEPTKSRTGC